MRVCFVIQNTDGYYVSGYVSFCSNLFSVSEVVRLFTQTFCFCLFSQCMAWIHRINNLQSISDLKLTWWNEWFFLTARLERHTWRLQIPWWEVQFQYLMKIGNSCKQKYNRSAFAIFPLISGLDDNKLNYRYSHRVISTLKQNLHRFL